MLSLLSVGFHMLFSVVSKQCKFDRKLVWFIVPVIRFYSVSFRLRFSLHARSHFLRSPRKKHVQRHSRQIEKRVYVLSFCFNIFLLVNWIFSIVHYFKHWFTLPIYSNYLSVNWILTNRTNYDLVAQKKCEHFNCILII